MIIIFYIYHLRIDVSSWFSFLEVHNNLHQLAHTTKYGTLTSSWSASHCNNRSLYLYRKQIATIAWHLCPRFRCWTEIVFYANTITKLPRWTSNAYCQSTKFYQMRSSTKIFCFSHSGLFGTCKKHFHCCPISTANPTIHNKPHPHWVLALLTWLGCSAHNQQWE